MGKQEEKNCNMECIKCRHLDDVIKGKALAGVSLAVSFIVIVLWLVSLWEADRNFMELQTRVQQLEDTSVETEVVSVEVTGTESMFVCSECQKDIVVDNCPVCNAVVKCYPVNERWYIKCTNCDLKTDYFDTVESLVFYWNTREPVNTEIESVE